VEAVEAVEADKMARLKAEAVEAVGLVLNQYLRRFQSLQEKH
jgi:hypothetical protein